MGEHKCTQAGQIEKLIKVIYGNGEKGLIEKFAIMDTTLTNINDSLRDNATAVRALLKFMNETKGSEQKEKELKNSLKWAIGISVTIIFGLIGLIFAT
jgi:hypothetical protein